MYALMGMVLGGVPDLIRDANTGGFHKRYLAGTIGAIAGGFLGLVGQCRHRWRGLAFTPATMVMAGAILAIGIVIPGVSTSFVLMFMGLYDPLLAALNRLDIPVLFYMAWA